MLPVEPRIPEIESLIERADDRDVSYVRDLGLIAADDPVRPANPIYWKVLHRALSARAEGRVRDTRATTSAATARSTTPGSSTLSSASRCDFRSRPWSRSPRPGGPGFAGGGSARVDH